MILRIIRHNFTNKVFLQICLYKHTLCKQICNKLSSNFSILSNPIIVYILLSVLVSFAMLKDAVMLVSFLLFLNLLFCINTCLQWFLTWFQELINPPDLFLAPNKATKILNLTARDTLLESNKLELKWCFGLGSYIYFNRLCQGSLKGGRGHWTVYYTSPQSFIIIGGVHQLIGYCLIPLDHWKLIRNNCGFPLIGMLCLRLIVLLIIIQNIK